MYRPKADCLISLVADVDGVDKLFHLRSDYRSRRERSNEISWLIKLLIPAKHTEQLACGIPNFRPTYAISTLASGQTSRPSEAVNTPRCGIAPEFCKLFIFRLWFGLLEYAGDQPTKRSAHVIRPHNPLLRTLYVCRIKAIREPFR